MNDTDPVAGPGPTSAAGSTTAPGDRPAVGDHPELLDDDAPVPPGRRVILEPTPPGFWRVMLGAVVAVLAPLFGILVGTSVGSQDTTGAMDPLYWGFFLGGLVGMLGLVAAGFGAATLIRHTRAQKSEKTS